MTDLEDIPRYRKRSNKKAPAKAKHKHEFANCVYVIASVRLDTAHGFVPAQRLSIGTYCPMCGKIGTTFDSTWRVDSNRWSAFGVWADKAQKEFDESTRTLPVFRIDDVFKQKYVKGCQENE